MKKILIIAMTILSFIFTCKKKDKKKNIESKPDVSEKQMPVAVFNSFHGATPNEGGFGGYWDLDLNSNKKMETRHEGEGGCQFQGTWELKNEKVIITPKNDSYCYWGGSKPSGGSYNCNIISLEENYTHSKRRGVKCLDYTFEETGSLRKNGSSFTLKGLDLIAMNKQGKTTTDVKYRDKPSKSGTSFKCKVHGEKGEESVNFIPKGKSVGIIARTKEKFKVDKWENYWYFISTPNDTDFYEGSGTLACDSNRGWVFGEFIE